MNKQSKCPEEIQAVIKTLEDAERKVANGMAIEEYVEALDTLNELIDDYPEHSEFIKNITTSYIRRMIDILYNNRPDIEQTDWLSLILALFGKNKSITVGIVKENELINAYFIELLGLWTEKAPSELKDVLDEMLLN